jgi:ATP-dependent DNA helicase PIF1
MELSLEQQYALNKFKQGENLFITGPGGTGKTRLIQTLVQHMMTHNIKFQVCALTGCAAILLDNCKARTLHSWAGIGIANGPKEKIVTSVIRNRRKSSNWKKVHVLIIDEISMMSKKIFELVDQIGKSIHHNNKPFGGIQVIFTGDFFQLPPVGNIDEEETSQFCFESDLWFSAFPIENHIQLKTIFRQKDPEYTELLNQIRWGEIDPKYSELLTTYVNRPKNEIISPVKLFATRAKTDFVNQAQYNKLEGEEMVYKMASTVALTTYVNTGEIIEMSILEEYQQLTEQEVSFEIDYLKQNSNRIDTLKLKIGAHVMCLFNIDIENGICNGTQGKVVEFAINSQGLKIPVVLFSNGVKSHMDFLHVQSDKYPNIGIIQIPLCLSWAITIHKIQGATLPMAEMDLGNTIFEYGQTYVALSRIQNLSGLYLSAFQPSKIKANPKIKKFYRNLPELDSSKLPSCTVHHPPKNIFARFAAADVLCEESYITEKSNIKTIRL